MSTKTDIRDFDTAFLFGDAATATVLVSDTGSGLSVHRPILSSKPELGDALFVPVSADGGFVRMKGACVRGDRSRDDRAGQAPDSSTDSRVRSLASSNKIRCSDPDLIYAAGLYDYLGDAIAIQLTSRLLQMLAPGGGGRLLIANFNPDLRDIGYLEA